jgi:hypothetical protein
MSRTVDPSTAVDDGIFGQFNPWPETPFRLADCLG